MRTLIFGASEQGKMHLEKSIKANEDVIGFVDNNKNLRGGVKHSIDPTYHYPCYLPEQLKELAYDKIVIAIESRDAQIEVIAQLIELGVSHTDIVLPALTSVRDAFFAGFARFVQEQNIVGNIAECGVYRGESAGVLNQLFPDRLLYLFDTFEGFTQQDIDSERSLRNESFQESKFNHAGGFSTSIDLVMEKMTSPEKVTIKKGWIPESLEGVDDTFCLVHLDMDLYQPTLAAMKFFWHKMSENGVMVLHDYYHSELAGVKKAVNDFEVHLGHKVIKLSVGDSGSFTLIKDYKD